MVSWAVLYMVLDCSILIIFCLTDKRLEVESQQLYYGRILDRLLKAPINLYFEVTPIGRILGFFSDDLKAFSAHFFS